MAISSQMRNDSSPTPSSLPTAGYKHERRHLILLFPSWRDMMAPSEISCIAVPHACNDGSITIGQIALEPETGEER
jgi:hypothetical protein